MIRAAVPSDAEAIARLHQRAWLHAYADIVPAEQILGWDMDERVGRWRERLAAGGPVATWAFCVEGRIVGFAAAGPADDGSGGGCLYALYVEPAAQGAGVGTALLSHAEAGLVASGFAGALVWVFVENGHGRRFYERFGWVVEEGSEEQGDWPAPMIRYRKALA